jgi:predicted unusual protein kinase regulating ubiquinone biosynthesis (AarF/ABC1/UbiB family)/MFS family permease
MGDAVTAPDASGRAATPEAAERDPERVRSFIGLAVARVGPRAFDVVHGTFLALLVGERTGSALLAALALTAHRMVLWLVLPLTGRLSDRTRSRFGRRAPYLGGGLVVMGVGTWSYTVIDGYWLLVGAILVVRLANTTRLIASLAVVPETFGRSRLLRAIVAIALAGMVVSLSVRLTVIATWDEGDPGTWATSFRLAAGLMVVAGIAVLVLVRDGAAARELASRPVANRPWRERIAEVLEVPNARVLLAVAFLAVAASGATGRLVPLFNREELGAGGAEQSTAILAAAVLGGVVSLPGALLLLRRFDRLTLALMGPLAASVGAAAHLAVTDLWQSVLIGVVTGAFGLASFLALLPMLLQLLPRSGGMGERLGLAMGPFALVGVASTYASAFAIDRVDSYRVMWIFPLVLGLVQAAAMTRLVVPPWSRRVRFALPRMGRRTGGSRSGRGGLFTGEVDVDDVDATVLFEVARRILGNPYEPPRHRPRDEPAQVAAARRVLTVSRATGSDEVAEVADLVDDDMVLLDHGEVLDGQGAALERLAGPAWELAPGHDWRAARVADDVVTLEEVPVHADGGVQVEVGLADGRVVRVERRSVPSPAQVADAHVAALGYPVPVARHLPPAPRRHRWVRTAETLAVAVGELGTVMVRGAIGQQVPPVEVARGLSKAFNRLGGGYAKLGQVIASSPSLVGEDVADALRATLDQGPVVPVRRVRSVIAADLGRPVRELFAEVDPEPLGRASIAVVHRARTVDGRDVAVKVVRPGIERTLVTDLALMEPLLRAATRAIGARTAGPLLQVLDGFRRQVAEELDLTNERRAMVHHRALLAEMDLPGVVIPEPVEALSGARVLTMELLDGVAVDDVDGIGDLGRDPGPVLEQVVKAWFTAAVRSGTFHGDVHAGNLMLLTDGRIALIDWGIVGRLDPATHAFFRHLIAAGLGDEDAWDDIGAHLLSILGPGLAGTGIGADDLLALVRPSLEAVLTRPFGEVSLGTVLADAQRAAAERRAGRRRSGRRRPTAPPFNRGVFLLGKQLLYFERYGRMHLGEVALLSDEDFFRRLLVP